MNNTRHCRNARRGLAPLELVLCLPVLLFVLALMVDTGSKSSWKLRGVVAARDAAWRSRWGRGGNLPNPASWPQPAALNAGAAGPNRRLAKEDLDHPVVRGPQFGSLLVDRERLDPTRGGWVGRSQRVWTPPLLPKLGAAAMDQEHPLLDGKWQYSQMGIPSTYWRRIPYLYTLPQAPAGLKAAFQLAVTAIQTAPFRSDLDVLDRDEEIRAWYGAYHNFHPQVGRFCESDRDRVAENQQSALIRRIQGDRIPRPRRGLPGMMTRFFISMYSQQRNQLLAQITKIEAGEATGAIAALQAQAGQLQAKIDLLNGYLRMLPN